MKSKGFTLIELLAVIIILGVLMIIAVPAVTNYISSTRKTSYITSVKGYIDGTRTKTNALEYPITDVETTYYVPTSCISLEKGGQSPFGDLQESYVVVTYNGSGYNYYYTGKDTAGYGITLTAEGLLDEDSLKPGTTSLDLNIGVGDRSNIIEFGNSCKSNDYTTRTATKTIEENKSFDLGVQELIASTPSNCFEFDEATGKITNYLCSGTIKDVVIPKKINNVAVTTIGEGTFEDKDIHTVDIQSNITNIEDYAFSYRLFLYNIVNRTGKSFNWYNILGIYKEDSNSFEVGTVFSSEKRNEADYIYAVEITNKKADYNIASMFQYVVTSWYAIESVTLNNNGNLDVYYKLANDSEWKPFNVGMTIGYDNLDSLASKMEISPSALNEFYNYDFSTEKMAMQIIPSINIKVENNGKVVFATSPTIFQRK